MPTTWRAIDQRSSRWLIHRFDVVCPDPIFCQPGEKLAADLVLAIAFTDGSTFAFPVVNFVYRF